MSHSQTTMKAFSYRNGLLVALPQAAFLTQNCIPFPELPRLSPKGRERKGKVMQSSTRGLLMG